METMKKKGYVIQELGYEYNDETYYRPEDGGGNPIVVITDESIAKKRMMELEIVRWRGMSIGHYGYGIDEIAEDEHEFEKALESMGLNSEDHWDLKIPKNATDEQIKRLIKSSSIRFYEIVEVDLEEVINLDEFGPSEEMLSIQDEMEKRSKKGIFDSVDQFVSGDIKSTVPSEVTISDIKEVIKETDDNFLSIKEEMKKLRDEARVKVKSFFLKGMNKIFEMYPEVKSVSWRQYTPYFNDGEECVFSANVDYFDVNGYGDYNDEGEDDAINVLEYDYNNGRQYKYHKGKEIHDSIESFLTQLDDDDYKTMFGDHVTVIVRKDEVVVEEYEHD